jgi:hypothetical protein
VFKIQAGCTSQKDPSTFNLQPFGAVHVNDCQCTILNVSYTFSTADYHFGGNVRKEKPDEE